MMVGAGGADTERGLDEETGETRSAEIWFEIDRDYFVTVSQLVKVTLILRCGDAVWWRSIPRYQQLELFAAVCNSAILQFCNSAIL